MVETSTKKSKLSENAPAPVQKNSDAPKQMNASEDVSSLGTNAGGRPVSSKPKKN